MNPIQSSRLTSGSQVFPSVAARRSGALLQENSPIGPAPQDDATLFQFEPLEAPSAPLKPSQMSRSQALQSAGYAGPYAEIHLLASQVGLLDLSDQHIERAMARGESLFVDYSV